MLVSSGIVQATDIDDIAEINTNKDSERAYFGWIRMIMEWLLTGVSMELLSGYLISPCCSVMKQGCSL